MKPVFIAGLVAAALFGPVVAHATLAELKACALRVESHPAAALYMAKIGSEFKKLTDTSKVVAEERAAIEFTMRESGVCFDREITELRRSGLDALADALAARFSADEVEAARLNRGEIAWGAYNERRRSISADFIARVRSLGTQQEENRSRKHAAEEIADAIRQNQQTITDCYSTGIGSASCRTR